MASIRDLKEMVAQLRHRGPDHQGFFAEGPVGLAHARLSIVDLTTGDQPVANEDGTVHVVFNGEIFNFIELRSELQKCGHVFRTQSDTETLVHAYEEYGDEFVHQLNGQFAIALWDSRAKRLLLIRDRVGIRPLFYQHTNGVLYFASEIKAIRVVSSAPSCLDLRGLAQVFTFWSTIGERTVFEGVRSLLPGHMLIVEHGTCRLHNYWNWVGSSGDGGFLGSLDEAADELRSILADAVRLQLRADVPVGAYLSGGLDSSAIVALIRQHRDVRLRTFSIAFDDTEFDESSYQGLIATHFGTDHSTIRCTRRSIGEAFPRLVWHAETPVVRTGPVPMMLLSGLVRESGYKVVLTGEGADEVFGGYDIFKEARIRRFWARSPSSRWRPALLARLYPYLRQSPVAIRAFAGSFFQPGAVDVRSPYFAHQPRWNTTHRLWGFLSAEAKAQIGAATVEDDLLSLVPKQFGRWNPLSRDQFVEATTLLSGYILSSQGDRVAMANSVESRVPFLDHRVIEFANRLPARFKLQGLREKAVLRRAMDAMLPKAVIERAKQPYRAPDCDSFFVNGRPLDYVSEMFEAGRIRRAGYFDACATSKLFEKCRSGRAIGFADNMAFVGVLSTMLLDEQFMNGAASVSV